MRKRKYYILRGFCKTLGYFLGHFYQGLQFFAKREARLLNVRVRVLYTQGFLQNIGCVLCAMLKSHR